MGNIVDALDPNLNEDIYEAPKDDSLFEEAYEEYNILREAFILNPQSKVHLLPDIFEFENCLGVPEEQRITEIPTIDVLGE